MPTLDLSSSQTSNLRKTVIEKLNYPADSDKADTFNLNATPHHYDVSPIEKNYLSILKQSKGVRSEIHVVRHAQAALSLQSFKRHNAIYGYSSFHENNQRYLKYIFKSLRMCYEYNLGEDHGELVASLVKEIFYSEEDLGAIFSNIMTPAVRQCCGLGMDADLLYPDRNSNSGRTILALEYFLHHIKIDNDDMPLESDNGHDGCAADTKISTYQSFLNSTRCFRKSGLPLTMATSSANPDAVLLLLRFGANPFISSSNEDSENAFSTLISSLNCLAFAKRACTTAGTSQILQAEEDKILLCLRYVRRAVKTLPVISSDSPDANMGLVKLITGELVTDTVQTVHKMYWSTLKGEGLLNSPSLQHLCRHRIRSHLSSLTDTLAPVAISHLPLPGKLKSYLNLYWD